MEEEARKFFEARLEDMAAWVRRTGRSRSTPFLDPAEIAHATLYLKRRAPDLRFALSGGYADAERRVLLLCPEYLDPEAELSAAPPFVALLLTWPARFYTLRHRDLLGAILGLGIKREQVGDILVEEGRAQVLVLKEIAPYIAGNLKSAGRAPVNVAPLPLAQLTPPPRRVKEIRTTLASPRLDSIVAAAFGLSRTKAVPLINGERVEVNFELVTDPAAPVPPGAILSVRGLGRARLVELGGTTKKGRVVAILERYL
ncbi:MAG: hypothetical protein PWP58_1216 [Bacillota bacterium]|nr:hypothetical protein [Bacillota bacterium]